jgi:hypothetical protein
VEGGVIARRAQIEHRELFVGAFCFLEANDIRLGLREPGKKALLSFPE